MKSTTGKAIIQDNIHADIQSPPKPSPNPTARQVETPDTTFVIRKVRTTGNAIALKRQGNFGICCAPVLIVDEWTRKSLRDQ
jgi:hypothetical protein